MECPKCESLIQDGAKFCEFCGHHFSTPPTPPYQTSFEAPEMVLEGRASLGIRFQNYIIDKIVLYFVGNLIYLVQPIDEANLVMDFSNPDFRFIILSSLLIQILYFVSMEYFLGKTISKFITKTSVRNLEGNRASIGSIILRTICRLIPLYELTILFNHFAKKWPISLHDQISKTMVVHD